MQKFNENFYKNWAISELIQTSFDTDIIPVYEHTNDKVDYTTYIHDVVLKDDGVYIPTVYVYNATNDMYEGKNLERKFTRDEYNNMFLELLRENATDMYNEYANVLTDKN